MKYLLVGLGNIGVKRRALLGVRCVATVDPFNTSADFRAIQDCAADRYDADYYRESPRVNPQGPRNSHDPQESGLPKRVQRGTRGEPLRSSRCR